MTSKKFVVSRFNNYKMVDGKPVLEQFHEIERLLNNFRQYNMHMDETIVVSSIIDKLPPSWKEMRKSLMELKKDISLEELATRLRLEEEYRKQDGLDKKVPREQVHNVQVNTKVNRHNKNYGKKSFVPQVAKNVTFKKKGSCFHCGKPGHYKNECRKFLKDKKEAKARMKNSLR